MTASERAKEINSKYPSSSYKLVEDAAHWAACGIHTGEELDRGLAISGYSDTYKDVHGFRPRHVDFSTLSTEKIEAMTLRLLEDAGPD